MSLVTLRRSPLLRIFAGILSVMTIALVSQTMPAQESFLVTTDDEGLSVFDLATYTLQKTMTAGYYTHSIIVGTNRRLAFLSANTGPMSVVDLTIGREIKKIPSVWGASSTLSNDGKSVLVWDDVNATLDIIDIGTLTVIRRVNLQPAMGAQGGNSGTVVQVGNKAFLAPAYFTYIAGKNGLAAVVDLSTFMVTAIPLPFSTQSYFVGWTGNAAATPDGKYVAMLFDVYPQFAPTLALIDTSTYGVTSQVLDVEPDAIVVSPNHSDKSKFFGYITGVDQQSADEVAVAVDFRTGSPTYGEILDSTKVHLTDFFRETYGSGLAISSDGGKILIAGDNLPPDPDLIVLDTGKMFSDPSHAIINSLSIGNGAQVFGLGIGVVNLVPPNSAPTVIGVQGNVTNNKASEITVTGTNFADGALVRIGGLPPLPATVDNASSLRVTVPVNAPADPGLDLIVTNPESNLPLDQQYQSGLLAGKLKIGLNPAFQPAEQFASLNLVGGSTVRMFDLKQREMISLTASPVRSLNAIEFAADGADLFGANFFDVSAWNTANGQMRGDQLMVPGLAIRRPMAPSVDPLTGKPVVYVPARSSTRPYDLLLNVIDANPQSPTFNTVLRQIPAGLSYQSPVTASAVVSRPDGKYVYAYFLRSDNSGTLHLAIYDTVHTTGVVVAMDRFILQSSQFQLAISPDGKWLVLQGYSYLTAKPQLKVFDIGTNPNNPRLAGVITPPSMKGVPPFAMRSYVIAGNHLFALATLDPTIVAFNFNPANNDYRPTAIYRLPGEGDYIPSPFAASPDGKYLYVPITDRSLIAVLDADKLAHGLDPLVTTIADSDSVHYMAASPVPPPANIKTRRPPAASARH